MKKNRIIAGITSLMIGITNLMPAIMANASTEAKASKLEMSVTLWGDANCDNEVTIADSVFIMRVISNPDKYGLGQDEGITEQGMFNADVYQHGTALTYADALSVCKFHLGIITELPESYYQELPNTTTTTTTTETATTTTKPTTTTTTKTTTTTTKPTTTTTTKTTTTTDKPTTTTTTKATTTTAKPTTTTTTKATTTTAKPTTTTTTKATTTTAKPTTTTTTKTTTTTAKSTTTTTTKATTTTAKPTTTTTTKITTTTTKPTTTTTTETTTTTTKPTTTTTTKTTTTTAKPTTTTTTKTTTITNPSTTTTMTTTTDDWNPPSKEALVHKGEPIEENTYNILLATAELFNIKEYDIIWSPVPIEGAYTDPGAYYCMRNGLAYGYGVQIIDSNNVTKVCPSMKRGPASQFIMDKYAVFRPEVPADSEPRVLESFEVADLCKKSDGKLVAGLWDLSEDSPTDPEDSLYEFDLAARNQGNPFNFMNWYLVPTKNGEIIDEPYNVGNDFNLFVEPGAEMEYWFTNEDLEGQIIGRNVFYNNINTARQLGIKNFKFVYKDNSETIVYSFMCSGMNGTNIKDNISLQLIPLSDLEKVMDLEGYLSSIENEQDRLNEWDSMSRRPYWYWTLRENYTETLPEYYTTCVVPSNSSFYRGYVMIPLTEDGEEDLRLYWPVQ